MDQTNFPKGIKTILLVLLIVLVAVGIFYFWSKNDNKVSQNVSTSDNLLPEVSNNIATNQPSAEQVLNALDDARTKGRDAKRVADIASIRVMLELYYDDHNSYPESLQVLLTNFKLENKSSNDPSTNQPYFYTRCGTENYHLGANLEINNINYLQVDNDKGPMCSADKIDGADNKGCDGANGLFCYDLAF